VNIAAYLFLADAGRNISDVSGDDRENSYMYLFQPISVLIQRFTEENHPDQWPLILF